MNKTKQIYNAFCIWLFEIGIFWVGYIIPIINNYVSLMTYLIIGIFFAIIFGYSHNKGKDLYNEKRDFKPYYISNNSNYEELIDCLKLEIENGNKGENILILIGEDNEHNREVQRKLYFKK